MLDVHDSRPLPAVLDAAASCEPVTREFGPALLGSSMPDPVGAARGVAAALVLSVPLWTGLIWVVRLLAG